MKKILASVLVLVYGIIVSGAEIKRDRGDNLYQIVSANTMGKGNIWVQGSGLGFIWDTDGKLRLFPELEVRGGILDFLQLKTYSRVVSYGFRPGYFASELKVSFLPIAAKFIPVFSGKGLRFWNVGFAFQYEKGLLDEFKASSGYRVGASGFSPEGLLLEEGSMNFILANDIDLIALSSYLPFSFYINTGYRMANDPFFAKYNQFFLGAGLEFKGVGVDFFAEFRLRTFNNFSEPLVSDLLPEGKRYLIYFQENEMYITPGARIRYNGGLTFFGAVSIKLSRNYGDELGAIDATEQYKYQGYLIKDGFEPFYADWILHGGISYPLRFRKPASEMYRGFLLKKNENRKKRIDIDQELSGEAKDNSAETEEDKHRLKQIEERKKKVMDDALLN